MPSAPPVPALPLPGSSETVVAAVRDRARLQALARAQVLDTSPEPAFDRLTALAVQALGVDAAFMVLVDADRQFWKSAHTAAGGAAAECTVTPLSHSLCKEVVTSGEVLAVDDTRADPSYAAHPATVDLGIGAYLGVPIVADGGQVLGTLCAADPRPRAWSVQDASILRGLAAAAGRELDLRAANRRLAEHERELDESRSTLARLLDATTELVCATDAEGRITYVNAAWERALGYTLAEATAMAPVAMVCVEDRPRYLAVARRLVTGAPVDDFEATLVAKDGRRVTCRGRAAVELRGGEVVGTRACYRDVTAERWAEAQRAAAVARLREREAQLELIYNGASDAMFLVAVERGGAAGRADYRCASVNAAYLRATGLAPSAVVGRLIEEIVPPEHAEFLRGRYEQAVGGAGTLMYEERVEMPAGEVHVETTLTAVRDAAGRCTHLLGAARDVTARRAAERALAASEARLRGMSAATPVGVFEADVTGATTYVNPRCCEIFGLAEDAMLGEGWQSRVHVDDLGPLLSGWRGAIAAGREYERLFRVVVPPGGGLTGPPPELRWAHGRAAPLRDAAGRVVGSVGTVEDVTDRQRAETAQLRLTSILEAMPDVVAVASPSGRVEYLNESGRRMLGVVGGAEAVRDAGLTMVGVQPQLAPGGSHAAAIGAAMVDGQWRGEASLTKSDGREIPVEQVILAHRGPGGGVEYLSSVLRDITERRQAEATLRAFALVDELTGLYNRRGFLALAEREWEAARTAGQGGVLVYLDLDGFKQVNDTYGHAEGDRALQAVAAVLRRTFRDADVLGRLGGDEYVGFARCGAAPGERAVDGARATAARLQQRLDGLLAEANAEGTRPYRLAASAGVALFDPEAPSTLSALMVEADAALYDRKRARKRVAIAA